MALCAPVRDMKNTAKVLSVVEVSNEPVTVTRNGRDVLIVMTQEAYDGLKSELAHERLMRRLDRAELEFDSVECFDGGTFLMRCWIVTMLKLVVSKGAAMELRGIAQHLEDEPAAPGAARSFIQEFKHQAELACSFPCSRPPCAHSELAQRGYRSFRVGRYVAIYSVVDDCLKALHVFHQSQDYVRDVLE